MKVSEVIALGGDAAMIVEIRVQIVEEKLDQDPKMKSPITMLRRELPDRF